MQKAKPRPATPRLVRTTRLEIVDDAGRVRASFGDAADGAAGYDSFGLVLYAPDGKRRAALSIDTTGPTLVFDQHGNNALSMGVDDPATEADPAGPYLSVLDGRGTSVFRVTVSDKGHAGINGEVAGNYFTICAEKSPRGG